MKDDGKSTSETETPSLEEDLNRWFSIGSFFRTGLSFVFCFAVIALLFNLERITGSSEGRRQFLQDLPALSLGVVFGAYSALFICTAVIFIRRWLALRAQRKR